MVAIFSIFTAVTRRGVDGRCLQYFHCFDKERDKWLLSAVFSLF